MKVRNGFVSNSSSSSFIVSMKERHVYPLPKEDVLTSEDCTKLTEYGFNEIKDENGIVHEFRYELLCNQDNVIEFLLTNNIPFEAECHYGHYHVFYYPKEDLVIEAYNYGNEISTYGTTFIDLNEETKGIKKFTRVGYLEEMKI